MERVNEPNFERYRQELVVKALNVEIVNNDAKLQRDDWNRVMKEFVKMGEHESKNRKQASHNFDRKSLPMTKQVKVAVRSN